MMTSYSAVMTSHDSVTYKNENITKRDNVIFIVINEVTSKKDLIFRYAVTSCDDVKFADDLIVIIDVT
jgi:hypothetical protein